MKKNSVLIFLFILLLINISTNAQITEERLDQIIEEATEDNAVEILHKLESIKDSVGEDLIDLYNIYVVYCLNDLREPKKCYELLSIINIENLPFSMQVAYWGSLIASVTSIDSALALQTFKKFFNWWEKNKHLITPHTQGEIYLIYKEYYILTQNYEKAYEYNLLSSKYNEYYSIRLDDLIWEQQERIYFKYKHILSKKNNRFKSSFKDLLILDSLYQAAKEFAVKKDILTTSIIVAKTLGEYDKLIYYSHLKDTINDLLCGERQKAKTDFILNQSKLKARDLEIKHLNIVNNYHKKINNIFIISLSVAILVIISMYILFKRVKKQKNIIESSKKIIESKNKDILDSIQYAKNIQSTILPDLSKIENDNCFVYYKPKDIVSGDFYWYAEKDQYKYYAAADCTGHGVPGALVSMLCSQALNEAIKLYTLPNEILAYVNQEISSHMSKFNRQDGMDIGLVAIDFINKKVLFSGANRPLFIYTDNKIEEITGTKHPIGIYNTNNQFELVELTLNLNDTIYLTTDGFIDQFGGPNDKKYGKKNFKTLILNSNQIEFSKHKSIIDSEFKFWKGENEQTDDICIIGIKL
ncbi:MAG: PP2C family protein-serine/threonine phosphatase [Bacteroidia bacterium]